MPSVEHLSFIEQCVFCLWNVKSSWCAASLVPLFFFFRLQTTGPSSPSLSECLEGTGYFRDTAPNRMWAITASQKGPHCSPAGCVQTWIFKDITGCSITGMRGHCTEWLVFFQAKSFLFLQLSSLVRVMKMWICVMISTYALETWP